MKPPVSLETLRDYLEYDGGTLWFAGPHHWETSGKSSGVPLIYEPDMQQFIGQCHKYPRQVRLYTKED